jgi:AcrR family transcriptional regulator
MSLDSGGYSLRIRFDDNRRQELLDGVIGIITARGFSEVTILEMAHELHCSVSSLYKIASNKDGLVLLAITRWGELVLEDMEVHALQGQNAADRARLYWRAGVESIRPLSHEFRNDVDRFDSARFAYSSISQRFIDRFVNLLEGAVMAGEIRPMNTRFLAQVFGQIALVVRDEQELSKSGLTAAEAILEVDHIIWEGILKGGGAGGVLSRDHREKRRHS